jgi:geranylgeranyl transferase type-2 subunit alpha
MERDGGSGLPLENAQQEDADEERRKAQQNDQKVLTDELQFTIPLLLASPKCYWIWNYRRHILSESISRLPTPIARRIWLEELGLDSKMLTKDRRNFHAWGYRRYLVGILESKELDGKSMVEEEFEFTTGKIKGDLSNFSAWHSRSKLIPRLLDERGYASEERRRFFEEELAFVHDALNVGPEDQSLWFYHQFLMASLIPGNEEYALITDFSTSERTDHLSQEIVEIKELAEDYVDVKWIYEALVEYTITLGQLRKLESSEEKDVRGWLGRLRQLDPMRRGRWDDLEASWKL